MSKKTKYPLSVLIFVKKWEVICGPGRNYQDSLLAREIKEIGVRRVEDIPTPDQAEEQMKEGIFSFSFSDGDLSQVFGNQIPSEIVSKVALEIPKHGSKMFNFSMKFKVKHKRKSDKRPQPMVA